MSQLNKFSLDDCAAALEKSGVPPVSQLVTYMQLLLERNEKINLTGAKNPAEFASKHIADVWRAYQVIGKLSSYVADVGSGGGIPGIILGIISPKTSVTLVERRHKKASTLSSIISQLELDQRIKVVARSFEEVKGFNESTEYWFRGFLPGPKLAAYVSEFFPRADLGQLVLMKGPAWPREKLDIMNAPKVKDVWKERFAGAAELSYSLSRGIGERLLVIV